MGASHETGLAMTGGCGRSVLACVIIKKKQTHLHKSHFAALTALFGVRCVSFYLARAGCRGPERLALKVSGVLMCLMSAARTAAATALHQTDSPQLPGVTGHGTRDDRARTRPALVTSCSACHTLQCRRFTWQDPLRTCPAEKKTSLQNRDIL